MFCSHICRGSDSNRISPLRAEWVITSSIALSRDTTPDGYSGPVAVIILSVSQSETRVRPERAKLGLKSDPSARLRSFGWQFARRALDLYQSVTSLGRVLSRVYEPVRVICILFHQYCLCRAAV